MRWLKLVFPVLPVFSVAKVFRYDTPFPAAHP
jgi:hypothetical protein